MSAITKIASAMILVFISFNVISAEKDADDYPIGAEEIALEKSLENNPRTYPAPKEYRLNLIACRANETDLVEKIATAVKEQDVDVVLYFHGGLSNQKYITTNLGPALIESVFQKAYVIPAPGEQPAPAKRKLYPIFMNYDAGVWDWDKYSTESRKIAGSNSYKAFQAMVEKKIPDEDKEFLATEDQTATSRAAAAIVYQFDRNKSLRAFSDFSEEEQTQYFLDILQAEELPLQFLDENKNVENELATLSKYLQDVDYEYTEQNKIKSVNGIVELNSGIKKSALATSFASLRVLRIFARMALGNDHGLDATIAEEVFDSLHVSTLGEIHWQKVKRHARQCFAEGSNGRNLVNKLKTIQQSRGRKIHTWSHSAGSIPTAELISYLGMKFKGEQVLEQVQMVAPAINQKEFSHLVLPDTPNTKVFNHLTAYALTQKYERDDELVWGLYPASLLYAVSSLADNTYYLDKMLILDQHMQPKRRPYRSRLYRRLTGERPVSVWNYFLGNTQGNASLYIYPQKKDTFHVDCETNKKCGPSHEGTKLPWLSSDLTRHVLKVFNVVDAEKLTFPKPPFLKPTQ